MANCCHAQYYFTVLEFRGIALALTLLNILYGIHNKVSIHIKVYVCEILLKSNCYKYEKQMNKHFCVLKLFSV